MSLFPSRTRPAGRPAFMDVATLLRRLWQAHRRRAASRASLERLLALGDDHLLQDIGIDRETGYRLVGATLVQPHRAWDRWPH